MTPMSEITVRALTEDEWQTYRDIRLRALREDPDAFAASAKTEEGYDEDRWRGRLSRSTRFVAEQDGSVVGVVSVGRQPVEGERVGELFGLWVTPQLRGKGAAWKLVESAVGQANRKEYDFLLYWVGTDNGRGVAFASSFGFRPTDARRPMLASDGAEPDPGEEPEEEMAMVYPLGDDPGAVPNSIA